MITQRFLPFTEFDKSTRFSYMGSAFPGNVILSYVALLLIVLFMVRIGFSGVELYYDISDPVLRDEVFSVSSFLEHVSTKIDKVTFDISTLDDIPVPNVPVIGGLVDFLNAIWNTVKVVLTSFSRGLGLLYGIISWFF